MSGTNEVRVVNEATGGMKGSKDCPACGHEAVPHVSAAGPTLVCNSPLCGEVTLVRERE